jgi:hypothetical protein
LWSEKTPNDNETLTSTMEKYLEKGEEGWDNSRKRDIDREGEIEIDKRVQEWEIDKVRQRDSETQR